MKTIYSIIAALILAGCQSTPTPAPKADNNDAILLVCEHALFAAAGQAVAAEPVARLKLQNCYEILDFMLGETSDAQIKRVDLCTAISWSGLTQMIAPEGGLVRVTSSDIFINDRSISDEFVYPLANSFWVALNKFLNPTPKTPALKT